MKILTAGSSGQLAQEIILQASAIGHEVIAPKESELDITNFDIVMDTAEGIMPDIIINCAAYNDVDKAETEWQKAYLVNGIGPKNLAIAAESIGCPIVHFGTDYVFDGTNTSPYTIADSPNPLSKYGKSKLLGEDVVKNHTGSFYIIRTSWVFGAGHFSFPRKVIEWAGKNKTLKIVDDQISSPTYTEDLAKGVLELIKTGCCGLYHLTNNNYVSKYGWASLILKTIGWHGELIPAKTDDFPTPAKRPLYSAMDNFPIDTAIGHILPDWQDATERFLRKAAR